MSGNPNKGLKAKRVCGWRAGDSLDSRGDLWELGQTHKRAQILGKSQLFPVSRDLQKDTVSLPFHVLKWGWREESCPSRQEGLVWVLTVTCGCSQVSALLSLSFPICKKLGVLSSSWPLFWGSILFLHLLVPLILKDSLAHKFPPKSYRNPGRRFFIVSVLSLQIYGDRSGITYL